MNEFLARLYNTAETVKEAAETQPEEETLDLEKEAADLFVSAATEQGIDLEKLSNEQVEELYVPFFQDFMKQAEEMVAEAEGEEKKDEKKKEEEKKEEEKEGSEEFTEEELQKFAEADAFGRIMAHSYVQELGNIDKVAKLGKSLKGLPEAYLKALSGKGVKGAKGALKKEVGSFTVGRQAIPETPTLKTLKKTLSKERGKTWGARGGTAAALGGGGAGAFAAGRSSKEKKASDEEYEQVVMSHAYDLLKEAGYDVEEPSEDFDKVAANVHTDALKLLEANGYEIKWTNTNGESA